MYISKCVGGKNSSISWSGSGVRRGRTMEERNGEWCGRDWEPLSNRQRV